MKLDEIFLNLKRNTNSITANPLLDVFDQQVLASLENIALTDAFVADKVRNIKRLIKDVVIDYNPKLKSAYDEYSEAITYLNLKGKFRSVERVPESAISMPDFKIEFDSVENGEQQTYTVYAEQKSMAFSDGNLNYHQVQEDALDSKINMEGQVKKGAKIAFGEFEVSPLRKSTNKKAGGRKYEIETLIDKIGQNIKDGQYKQGETVLIVDLKQLLAGGDLLDSLPVFTEPQFQSLMSGLLWNISLGTLGNLVFKQIEFEGKENIEGVLEREGILVAYPFIKAICFMGYKLSSTEPVVIGFYRRTMYTDAVSAFLHGFCDFINDDGNSYGFRIDSKGSKIEI